MREREGRARTLQGGEGEVAGGRDELLGLVGLLGRARHDSELVQVAEGVRALEVSEGGGLEGLEGTGGGEGEMEGGAGDLAALGGDGDRGELEGEGAQLVDHVLRVLGALGGR